MLIDKLSLDLYIPFRRFVECVYMQSVTQIKVGKHGTGIVGLNEVLKGLHQISL